METTLNKLKPNNKAIVTSIDGIGSLKRRLVDMGVTPGVSVYMRKTAPLGDPIEINLRGYSLTLRKSEAQKILIQPI